MNYVWGFMMMLAVVCGMITGKISQVSQGILSGGTQGVELCVSLLGMMILWGGLTEIMEQSGLSHWLGKGLTPFLNVLFPELKYNEKAKNAIAMNIAANMLGLGNAATPLGLKAMEELNSLNHGSKVASNSMVTFVVLNSVSVQLIPTGLFVIRKQFGAVASTNVLTSVWFASVLSAFVGVGLAWMLNYKRRIPHGTYW